MDPGILKITEERERAAREWAYKLTGRVAPLPEELLEKLDYIHESPYFTPDYKQLVLACIKYYQEFEACIRAENWLAAVLVGSAVLEGSILLWCFSAQDEILKTKTFIKLKGTADDYEKKIFNLSYFNLIDIACDAGCFHYGGFHPELLAFAKASMKGDTEQVDSSTNENSNDIAARLLAHMSREARNFIHPGKLIRDKSDFDTEFCRMIVLVIRNGISALRIGTAAHLGKARSNHGDEA